MAEPMSKPSGPPYNEPPPPYSATPGGAGLGQGPAGPGFNMGPPPTVSAAGYGSLPAPSCPVSVTSFAVQGYGYGPQPIVMGAAHGPHHQQASPSVGSQSNPPSSSSSITVTAAVIVNVQGFGPYPMQTTCHSCRADIMTETLANPGLLTWILSGTLLLIGCWAGCCLIPCCIPECQDIEHRCPNCKTHLGTYRRI